MVTRSASSRAFAFAVAIASAACGIVAGLPSDYGPGLVADAGGDATTDDAGDGATEATDDAVTDTPVGPDAPIVTLPPPDNDNVTPCGNLRCPTNDRVCCFDQSGTASCTDKANPLSCRGLIAACDQKENCENAALCCVIAIEASGFASRCAPTCPTGVPQSCRSDSECSGGAQCIAWQCHGYVIATCGGLGRGRCPP